MGKWQPAPYYDEYFTRRARRSAGAARRAYIYPMWRLAAKWIRKQGRPVLDLGCGPGYLLEVMRELGVVSDYLGIDFSEGALRFAEHRALGDLSASVIQVDVEDESEDLHELSAGRCVVLCETLEHMRDDLGVLGRLAPDCPIWFSVPDFDVRAHVRRFAHEVNVVRRYRGQIRELVVSRYQVKSPVRPNPPTYFIGSGKTGGGR